MNFWEIAIALCGHKGLPEGKTWAEVDEEICAAVNANPQLATEEQIVRTTSTLDLEKQTTLLPMSLACFAAAANNTKVLKCLIDNGAALDKIFHWYMPPVFFAATYGSIEAMQMLLDSGASLTIESPPERNVLSIASSTHFGSNDLKIKRTHIDSTDTLQVENDSKNKAQLNVVDFLLKKNPSWLTDNFNKYLLIAAVTSGNIELVKFYVDMGMELEAKDEEGLTPLAMAADCGKSEIFEYLRSTGTNLSVVAEDGRTLAHFAANGNNSDIVRVVRDLGIEMNTPDSNGKFPVHHLICSPHRSEKAVKEILDLDIFDLNPQEKSDCPSAIFMARKEKFFFEDRLEDIFLAHGAKESETDLKYEEESNGLLGNLVSSELYYYATLT